MLAIWKDPTTGTKFSSNTKTDAEGRYQFASPFEVAESVRINDYNTRGINVHQNVQPQRDDVDFILTSNAKETAHEISWGNAANGLQLGLRAGELGLHVGDRPRINRIGTRVDFEVVVRNLNDTPIRLRHFGTRGYAPLIEDAAGNRLIVNVPVFNEPAQEQKLRLAPGEQVSVGSVSVVLASSPLSLREPRDVQNRVAIKPGTYQVSQVFRFDEHIEPDNENGSGELHAGSVRIKVASSDWGQPVEGVRMRVTKGTYKIVQGEKLDLHVDIHNNGEIDRRIDLEHEAWELEIDGKWLQVTGGVSGVRRHLLLASGQTQTNVEVTTWLWENMAEALKDLPPGKHTLRVARLLNGESRSPKSPPQIRIVSQPIKIEIVINGDAKARNEAVDLPDGIYRVRAGDSEEQGTEVKRSDADGTIVLLQRLTDQFGLATIQSDSNDNTHFHIYLKKVGPLNEEYRPGHYAFVIDGICLMVSGHQEPDQEGLMEMSANIASRKSADKIADRLGVIHRLRAHPGHQFETTFNSVEKSYLPNEPIVLEMKIQNVGDVPFSFYDGGQQRGARNNQFGFAAFRNSGDGEGVPDTGDPNNFGGMAGLRKLKPGESFQKQVDITKWFDLSQPDTYKISGRFEMELHDPEEESYFVLWDDIAQADCQVLIESNDKLTQQAMPKGLESLSPIRSFREFRLKMTEQRLRELIHANSLAGHFDDEGDENRYHLYASDNKDLGENVIIGFRNEECSGIQRMRPDPDGAKQLFEEQFPKQGVGAYFKACEFLYEGGDRKEAVEKFRRVAELAPLTELGARARELAGLLEQMNAEQRPEIDLPSGELDASGDTSLGQEVEDLVFDLRDVAGQASLVSGKCRFLLLGKAIYADTTATKQVQRLHQLAQSGSGAEKFVIPKLIELLGDRRPTRSWAGALNGGHVLRNCDVALEILSDIAGANKPNSTSTFDPRTTRDAYLGNADVNTRKEIVARVRGWWAIERQSEEPGGNRKGNERRKIARALDEDARQQFLEIERMARAPLDEQAMELPRLYKELAPRYMNPFVMGILSSNPQNILDRDAGSYGDSTGWAQQLEDVASDLTADQVADNLEHGLWLNVAARERAMAIFKRHSEAVEELINADLDSRDKEFVERATTTIQTLELRTFTDQVLTIFIANNELSESAYRALLFLDDPAISNLHHVNSSKKLNHCPPIMGRTTRHGDSLSRHPSDL